MAINKNQTMEFEAESAQPDATLSFNVELKFYAVRRVPNRIAPTAMVGKSWADTQSTNRARIASNESKDLTKPRYLTARANLSNPERRREHYGCWLESAGGRSQRSYRFCRLLIRCAAA